MGQFADDLWSTLIATVDNLEDIMAELQRFHSFSGLQINSEKTAILRLGPFKNSEAKFYTKKKLFWSPKDIRILGFQIFPDLEVMQHKNFEILLGKVKDMLNQWSNVDG